MAVGYSKRSLVKKLGIKEGFTVILINQPVNYMALLEPLPENCKIHYSSSKGESPHREVLDFARTIKKSKVDFIQFFTTDKKEFQKSFPKLKQSLVPNGSLWISWPKTGSKIPTNLNENVIRDIGLENGLVDVKVIAVDEIWSGLKFIYRLKDRNF